MIHCFHFGIDHIDFNTCQTNGINTIHARMDEFKCSICEKGYSSKDSQKRHEKDQHKPHKSFNCQDCGKQFSRKSHLTAHTNNIHEGVKFKCDKWLYL